MNCSSSALARNGWDRCPLVEKNRKVLGTCPVVSYCGQRLLGNTKPLGLVEKMGLCSGP